MILQLFLRLTNGSFLFSSLCTNLSSKALLGAGCHFVEVLEIGIKNQRIFFIANRISGLMEQVANAKCFFFSEQT